MKKIKAVVLKDSTKLTSSQMKQIRGGDDPETLHSSICTTVCHTGAIVEYDCSKEYGKDAYCSTSDTIGYVNCHIGNDLYTYPVKVCPDFPPVEVNK